MTRLRPVAALALLSALAARPAGAATLAELAQRFPTVDRALYPFSGRLGDDQLRIFIGLRGADFVPGRALPHWAPDYVEHWLRTQGGEPISPGKGAPPAEATAGPNVNLSNNPALIHSESFIAIDPTNPMRLVASSNQINANPQMLFYTANAGQTWGSVEFPLGNADFHSDPAVCWDSQGTAYSATLGIGTTTEIQVIKSSDGGRTWTQPVVPNQAPGNDKEFIAANFHPATACQDLVCVAWDDANSGDLHVACSPRGAGPWSDKIVASGGLIGAIPVFGPGGELYVAWTNYGGRTIDFVRSDDCGATWSQPAPIATTRVQFDMSIPAMCSRRVLIYPAVDVDRSSGARRGTVYAIWTDGAPGASCPGTCNSCPSGRCSTGCSSNVYFSRSNDGGVTWSAAVPVHTDTQSVDQFNPWLAVDDTDGSVHVAWDDTRNFANRTRTDVYYRRSTDGGQTWEPEVRVTTAMTDETAASADNGNQYGDYNGLAALACKAYPSWTDRRGGAGEQIFSAEVSSAGSPPRDLGNTLRARKNPARDPVFSWPDLGGAEVDYRVYRGVNPDFATVAPNPVGTSGGGDYVVFTHTGSPTATGANFYKVRGIGPCAAESTSW